MSADNWAVCPRCNLVASRAADERAAAVTTLYGKVPLEEYERARSELLMSMSAERMGVTETFREDWEIYGAETGVVKISYRGSCLTCGLSASHEHELVLPVEES